MTKIYTVTTTADSGTGSLRNIINCINDRKSCHISTIKFNIPSSFSTIINGVLYYTIQPGVSTSGSSLPTICYPVDIEGINCDSGIINLDGSFATIVNISSVGVPIALTLIGRNASRSTINYVYFTNFGVDIYLDDVKNTKINYNSLSTPTINQSSIIGNCIHNLNVTNNTFITTVADSVTTDTNGIFLTNPTGKIKIKNNTFVGFSDVTSLSNGNGIYILLNNGCKLNTLKISGNVFSDFSNPAGEFGGSGILVDFEVKGGIIDKYISTGNTFSNVSIFSAGMFTYINATNSAIKKYIISNCYFSDFNYGATAVYEAISAANCKINNFNVSACTFNNFSNGSSGILNGLGASGALVNKFVLTQNIFNNFSISSDYGYTVGIRALVNEGTINYFIVSDCTFNTFNNLAQVILAETNSPNAIITNFDVLDSNFNDLDTSDGVLINPAGPIVNTNILGCLFNNVSNVGSAAVALIVLGGSQEIFNVSKCTFNNISNSSGGIVMYSYIPGTTVNNMNILENKFNIISNNSQAIATNFSSAPATINNLDILKNTFKDIIDTSNAVLLNTTGGVISNINESYNIFSGANATATGWATSINVGVGDSTCLNFKNNKAVPSAQVPYNFVNSGGTFNKTAGSDNSTNIGQFSLSGVIGTCSPCA